SDEPASVDVTAFLPSEVSKKTSVKFENEPLKRMFDWIRTETGLDVVVDESALSQREIKLSDKITDHLDNAPLYLLLDRLRELKIAWYFKDHAIYVTTTDEADKILSTVAYHIGDLLDDGYGISDLHNAIEASIHSNWTQHCQPGPPIATTF